MYDSTKSLLNMSLGKALWGYILRFRTNVFFWVIKKWKQQLLASHCILLIIEEMCRNLRNSFSMWNLPFSA